MVSIDETKITASDVIVKELIEQGVKIVYGIVSIHNMPIFDAIKREGSIRIIAARGESGAVNMADGYARSTGKLGVVLTSTGAGAGNAAGSLTESWNSGTPILHITGEVASNYIGTGQRYIHECKDQLSMMDGASKKAYLLKRPEQTGSFIRRAIAVANTIPLGPVTVQIPTDFQTAIIPKTYIVKNRKINTNGTSTTHSDDDINIPEEVILKIKQSKSPIIWSGGGVIASNASNELEEFVDLIQPAVITSESGKGSIPENHPLCIGNFTNTSEVRELLKNCDLLISIGTHFRSMETSDWTLYLPEDHINIDADPNALNRNYNMTYGLVGDAKLFLQNLNDVLAEHSFSPNINYVEKVKLVRTKVRENLRESIGPSYTKIVDGMRQLTPRESIIVRDVTMPAFIWGNRLFEIYKPRTSISISGGGIGQGLPLAIGAQIGNKEEVVVLMAGDGGFMVNVGELATAVEEELPLVIILFNNSGYGILRYLQDAAYGRRAAVDLVNPNFVQLAKSMGFNATEVKSEEEFLISFEDAVSKRKSSMIVVDQDAIGPMNHPYEEPEEKINSYRPQK